MCLVSLVIIFSACVIPQDSVPTELTVCVSAADITLFYSTFRMNTCLVFAFTMLSRMPHCPSFKVFVTKKVTVGNIFS